MARSRRPIDPPDPPHWRRDPTPEEDETPTLTGLEGADPFESEETQWEAVPPSDSVAARWAAVSPAGFMTESDATMTPRPLPRADESLSDPGASPRLVSQPLGVAKEDPRALAQRLAAEAKARASSSASPSEDPRVLARRLAENAKAKLARAATPAPALEASVPQAPKNEDPRELARRLAAEAKARHAAQTPAPAPAVPAPPQEDPRELARRLAAEAKARIASTPPASEPAPSPAPAAPSHLERKVSRPRSAKEILEEAMRADAAKEAAAPAPQPVPVQPTPAAAPPVPSVPPAAPPQPMAAPVQSAPASTEGSAILLQLLPGAEVEAPVPVARPEVFHAVWRAHRTRALHEQDWSTVSAASVLLEAASRQMSGELTQGNLVGCRVALGGTPHAVFADLQRRCVLAILAPADVYLAGLST